MPRSSLHPALARTTPLALSFNGNGDNVIIAAPTAGRIFVYRLSLIAASAVNAIFKDGATALWGTIPLPTSGDLFNLPFDSEPWFTTSAGNAFIINLSSGVACAGCVYYTTSAGLT